MDGQDVQDFSGGAALAIPDIHKSARDHRRSQPLVQKLTVTFQNRLRWSITVYNCIYFH